jgi:hypothetical protein
VALWRQYDHPNVRISPHRWPDLLGVLRGFAPMVLVPWGRDQPGVATRGAALSVAGVVPRENASGGIRGVNLPICGLDARPD